MRAMKSFASSVALITAFAVATRAIGFFFRIFLSRVLGAEMLGVYQIALSFFMVFLTLVSSGLPLAISKRVATKQSHGVIIAGLVISLTASTVACAIVLAFNGLLGVIFTDARCVSILIVLLPSIFAACFYAVIRAVWWGEKRYFLLGATELMEQILRVIVFVIMLAFAFLFVDMAQIAALSYTVAFALASIIIVVMYFKTRKLDKTAPKLSQYKPILKSAAPITGMRLLGSIAMPIIAIIIPMRLIAAGWTPAAAMAAFGIVVGMTMPLLTLPSTLIGSLTTALVPELSPAYAERKMDKVNRQISNAVKFTLFINFLMLPAFIALGEGLGAFLYAEPRAGEYLTTFAWVMIPMSLSQLTNAILNSLGAETRSMRNYVIGAVFLFLIVWFLTPIIGIGALIVGLGTCMGIASTLNLILIAKLTSRKLLYTTVSQIVSFSLVCVPAALSGFFLYGILIHVIGLFFSLLICGAVAIAVFLGLCHMFGMVKLFSWRLKADPKCQLPG